MTFVSDATSLILLAKVGLLEMFVVRNNVVMPPKVYDEVAKGKDKGRLDAFLVERLAAEKTLSISLADKETKAKIEKLFNIRGGELEVLAVSLAGSKTVLTDDKKCLAAAKALKLNFITSLDVVVALYRRGVVSKERAIEAIESLEEYGWYSKDVIKSYKEAVK
ncbi:hypothetical protein HYV85_01330 [Candidatus Woesearchaeota archaeon]|nr:hypothetical protein [Candidatus Woesearchaeota archaeon]